MGEVKEISKYPPPTWNVHGAAGSPLLVAAPGSGSRPKAQGADKQLLHGKKRVQRGRPQRPGYLVFSAQWHLVATSWMPMRWLRPRSTRWPSTSRRLQQQEVPADSSSNACPNISAQVSSDGKEVDLTGGPTSAGGSKSGGRVISAGGTRYSRRGSWVLGGPTAAGAS
jgi:hypothetical protein